MPRFAIGAAVLFQRNAFAQRRPAERLFVDPGDVGEADCPVEECRYGHFVRCVQHGSGIAAGLAAAAVATTVAGAAMLANDRENAGDGSE